MLHNWETVEFISARPKRTRIQKLFDWLTLKEPKDVRVGPAGVWLSYGKDLSEVMVSLDGMAWTKLSVYKKEEKDAA